MMSSWRSVTGGVLWGSVPGLVLFNAVINNLGDGTEHSLIKVANGRKLGEAADTLEGCATMQKYLVRLEKWTDGNLIKLNEGK